MLLASCCLLSCVAQLPVPGGHLARIPWPALRCPLEGLLAPHAEGGREGAEGSAQNLQTCGPPQLPLWPLQPLCCPACRGAFPWLWVPGDTSFPSSSSLPPAQPLCSPAKCPGHPCPPRLPCWARPQHCGRRWHRCRGEHESLISCQSLSLERAAPGTGAQQLPAVMGARRQGCPGHAGFRRGTQPSVVSHSCAALRLRPAGEQPQQM